MTGDPRFDWYDWAGGREAMLRFGPEHGPVAVAALPLFEEANRTRAFMVQILRDLAARGMGSVLPDMPGQGESLVPLETVSLDAMRTAFGAACRHASDGGRRAYTVTIRSGALLDREASLACRWHLSPQQGNMVVRELSRMQQADHANSPAPQGRRYGDDAIVEIAGNLLSAAFLRDLDGASLHGTARTLRLASDTAPADRRIEGPALWRRSEPGDDLLFARALAEDIAGWIATCEG